MIKVIVLLSEGSMSLPPRHIRRGTQLPPVAAAALLDLALWTRERRRMSSSSTTSPTTLSPDTSTATDCTPISVCVCVRVCVYLDSAPPGALINPVTRIARVTGTE